MRHFVILLIFSININVMAQIAFKEKLQYNSVQNASHSYDSLENINIKNVMSHVGQTICYVGDTIELRNGWTQDFYSDDICSIVYKAIPVIDGLNRNVMRTEYQAMAGRYFYVNDVFDYNPESEYNKIYRLQLIDVSKADTIYWKWEPDPKYSFSHFVTLGYFEKMKRKYIGDTMILRVTLYRQILQSGEKTDIIKGSRFKCLDLVMSLNDSKSLRAILKNERYGEIEAYLDGNWGSHGYGIYDFYSQRHIDSCVKKYGMKFGKQIACGQIDIGMTETMVKEAYGKPSKINYTTISDTQTEQWVYDYDDYMIFVYFKNGKVFAIQN